MEKPALNITYSRTVDSAYDEISSTHTCSIGDCVNESVQNDTFYEPLNDGYIVSSISKAEKVFLELDTGDEIFFYNHDG